MSSNLAYLQQQVRLTGAAGTLQGPINEFEEGFITIPTKPNGPNATAKANATRGQVATIEDLRDFIGKIQGEILRLSASGTNDPIIKSRVAALTDMKANIQQIIDQVEKGTLMAVEIPVMKNDLDRAFPILGKPGEPLPDIIKTLGLPKGLANALPSSVQKDPQTMRQINMLVDKYADQIINGVSASFSVKYTSPNEANSGSNGSQQIIQRSVPSSQPSTIDKTGYPSVADLSSVSNTMFMPVGGDAPVTDQLAARPTDAGRGPSHFDWKARAKQIEDQIKQRGLNPTDFGIDPKLTTADRSKEFSWKGYAKMICTRLQATMDPALPETCGCPPMDWKGWR
jgi:hypothetical protein